jgi:hypothetical protein
MKHLILLFVFCSLSAGLILSGCAKKKSSTLYIPEQMIEYSVFQAGSYWVFKNEITGIDDSIYIICPPIHGFSNISGMEGGQIWEGYNIVYSGSLFQEGMVYPSEYDMIFKHGIIPEEPCPCLMSLSFHPGFTDANIPYLFKNLEYFDSLKINNNMFYQVLHTQWKWTHSQGDTTTADYFLAKSIGIIKLNQRDNKHDTTWTLLRYHVYQ